MFFFADFFLEAGGRITIDLFLRRTLVLLSNSTQIFSSNLSCESAYVFYRFLL